MKKLSIAAFLFLLVAFVVTGCGGLKSKIVGSWQPDASSLKIAGLDAVAKTMGASNPAQLKTLIEKGMKETTMDLKSDGTFAMGGGQGTQMTGKWELKDHTLQLTPDKGNAPQDLAFTVDDSGSKIHMSSTNAMVKFDVDFLKSK